MNLHKVVLKFFNLFSTIYRNSILNKSNSNNDPLDEKETIYRLDDFSEMLEWSKGDEL